MSCKQLFDIKITDKNIKTDFLAENTELGVQKYKLRGCLAHKALCSAGAIQGLAIVDRGRAVIAARLAVLAEAPLHAGVDIV